MRICEELSDDNDVKKAKARLARAEAELATFDKPPPTKTYATGNAAPPPVPIVKPPIAKVEQPEPTRPIRELKGLERAIAANIKQQQQKD